MKQPSDLTSNSSPSASVTDAPAGVGLPPVATRILHATVLLHNFAATGCRAGDTGSNESAAAAVPSATLSESDTWRHIADVLADAEWTEQNSDMEPEGLLANALILTRMNDYHEIALLHFDFYYAVAELAKANLMLARLGIVKDEGALPVILESVEAKLSAIVDALLDAIPDFAVDHANAHHQFAA